MPQVAVIIPVYNTGKYLERCLNSLFKQTFQDFEALLINDGSTDDSLEIAERLTAGHCQISIATKVNGGLSSARLYGLLHTSAPYVVFVDSDDYLEPLYLERLYKTIVQEGADISMCSYYTQSNTTYKNQILKNKNKQLLSNSQDILNYYIIPQIPTIQKGSKFLPAYMWLRLFKREILSPEFFENENRVIMEDLYMSLQLYGIIKKIVIIDEPLYYYCINSGSLTMKYRKGAWNMICNLHEATKQALNSINTEEVSARLQGQLLVGAFFCLRNSMAQKQYCTFKTIFEAIRKNKDFKQEVLRCRLSNISLKTKIMLSLIKWNIPEIMYFLYKIRNDEN